MEGMGKKLSMEKHSSASYANGFPPIEATGPCVWTFLLNQLHQLAYILEWKSMQNRSNNAEQKQKNVMIGNVIEHKKI